MEWEPPSQRLFLWCEAGEKPGSVVWAGEERRPRQLPWDPEPEPWPRRPAPGRQTPEDTVSACCSLELV